MMGLKMPAVRANKYMVAFDMNRDGGLQLSGKTETKIYTCQKTFPFLSVIHHTNLSRNKMTFSFPEPLGCSDRRRNRNKRRLETRIRSQDWSEVRETIFAHSCPCALKTPYVYFFCFGLFINTMPISIDSHDRICCLKFSHFQKFSTN